MGRHSFSLAPLLLAAAGIWTVQGGVGQNNGVTLEFEGNKIIPSQQLLEVTNGCLNRWAEPQGGYNADHYDYCLRRTLADFIRSRGYLRVVIGEQKRQQTA